MTVTYVYRGVEYTKTTKELMTHQTPKTESHHDKPEEHEEKKETFDEDISLEEALSTL